MLPVKVKSKTPHPLTSIAAGCCCFAVLLLAVPCSVDNNISSAKLCAKNATTAYGAPAATETTVNQCNEADNKVPTATSSYRGGYISISTACNNDKAADDSAAAPVEECCPSPSTQEASAVEDVSSSSSPSAPVPQVSQA
jgi:hypothetical protein